MDQDWRYIGQTVDGLPLRARIFSHAVRVRQENHDGSFSEISFTKLALLKLVDLGPKIPYEVTGERG